MQMFDIERFAADCRAALAERGGEAIREVVRRAISESGEILRALGQPTGASVDVLIRTPDLTILNAAWGVRQWTLPHNHNYRAVIGMYGGGEDNIFWRRLPEDAKGRVEAAGAQSLRQGDVALLGRDIIHSVTNPLDKLSMALHVYDGDFIGASKKSCWNAETLTEAPYDAGLVSPMFGQALVLAAQSRA
jgi:predicted metal-dependent enzyme (double-stranded beta helix superfamily)